MSTPRGFGGMKARVQDALKLPNLSPRSPRDPTAAVSSAWDAVAEGVQQKARAMRVSLKEQKEAQQAAILQGYVSAMRGNADIAAVQEESLIALTNIIAKGSGIRTLVRTGGLDTIVLAMNVHLNTADIQQRAATAIATVAAVGDDCRDAVVSAGCVQALVDASNRHPDLPGVLERCCYALSVIAANNAAAQEALIDAHAVTAITRALRLWPRRANLVNKGVTALANVASGSAACKMALVHTGGVGAVCESMEEHTGHAEIQQTGCYCLAGVSRGGDTAVRALVRSGGIRRLVGALRWYPTQSSMVHVIASALASVGTCADETVRNEVAAASVMPHLVSALVRHRHRAAVSERGLAALCNLMMGGSRFVAGCIKQGGFDYMTEVMGAHAAHPSLLLQGCHCVLNAAACGDVDAKEGLVGASCPEKVLAAMSAHPANAHLVEVACAALANVAAGAGDEHDEELAITQLSLQEPDPRITTSPSFSQGPKTPSTAAPAPADHSRPGTSASVSRSRPGSRRAVDGSPDAMRIAEQLLSIRTLLLDAGTAFNVVKSMSDFKALPSVTEEGICVLRNLAAGESTVLIDRLLKCESAQAVSYSMRMHKASNPICLQGCLAIRNLACGTSRHLSMLIEASVIESIIEALSEHRGEPILAQAGCAALRNLAVDSWGSDQPSRFSQSAGAVGFIIDADGPAAIVDAMAACVDSAGVQAQGCGALRNLACGTLGDTVSRSTALSALLKAESLEAVLAAMRAHKPSRQVQAQACGALRNLAIGPECRGALFQLGAVRAVVEAVAAHRESFEVLEQATACLANLLFTPNRSGSTHGGGGGGGGGGNGGGGGGGNASGGARSPSPVHWEDMRREAVAAGAVGEMCALLASRRPGPALHAAHAAAISINACACLATLMESDGEVAREVCAHEGTLDGIVGLCTVFGADSPSAVEHASACMARLLSTGGEAAKELLGATERKSDLSKVLTSAFERGLIRMDVPGFDVLINLMAPPPASGRGGR